MQDNIKLPLLELSNINKVVKTSDKIDYTIVKDINLTLNSNEIVGLIGRSGSGKSTILRMIAGFVKQSSGDIKYMGAEINGHQNWLSMVFQSFALFPWLTVYENVAIGLESIGLPVEEVKIRTLNALDLIGLDGYELAYPRELSGGMRQRVGLARALVVRPEILLLDEPFSALDILTAAALKAEFMDLWMAKKAGLKSVLLVTHNIEEAVLLCDRILILSSNPGTILAEIPVSIPHPRSRNDSSVQILIESIYTTMTSSLRRKDQKELKLKSLTSPIPDVSTNALNGIVEVLLAAPYNGKAYLPQIAEHFALKVDSLFPVLELMEDFGFAVVAEGDVKLTTSGKTYAEADVDGRKKIFAEHLIENIPLASHIYLKLKKMKNKKLTRLELLKDLRNLPTTVDINVVIKRVISFGRYAELFYYDDSSYSFSLEG